MPPTNLCADCASSLRRVHGVARGGAGGSGGGAGVGAAGGSGADAGGLLGPPLRGLALTDFEADSARILSAIKDQGQTALIGPLVAAATEQIVEFVANAATWPEPAAGTLTLIPVPSRSQGIRKRGFVPAELWAKQIARVLKVGGFASVRVLSALEFVKNVSDQRGLSVEQRHENLVGSMRLRPQLRKLEGRALLIDDVVTTGATIAEAARALNASSFESLGFLTFAETLLKTNTANPKWV